jgi:predicted aspartyl protease
MRKIWAGIIYAMMSLGGAQATTLWTEHVGHWDVSAFSSDETGQFDDCMAFGSYDSGTALIFFLNKDHRWAIAFTSPIFQLTKGNEYTATYSLDDQPIEFTTGIALSLNLMRVQLKDDGDLLSSFRRSKILHVSIGSRKYNFTLTDISQVLTYLVSCVAANGSKPVLATAARPLTPEGREGHGRPALPLPPGAPVQPTNNNAKGIPISVQGGTFLVPVLINGQITLNFTIDSGAADVTIPADVVSTLIRTGTLQKSDFVGQKIYRLADGSTVPSATFLIRSLKVGNHLLEDVTGSIASAQADLLLGQSFLARFNSWSIDNKRQVLLLN